jgi:O-antigen ligase
VIKPDPRDASSDLYRVQEDANLKLNMREGKPLGRGFGVPIDYALPIQDISSIDPLIKYIPHNGILYILMRMGYLGGVAFWSMIGIAIITACRLARSRDRELAMVGAVTAALVVAYVFEGATDQGFFFYRIAFVVGTMLGLCEAARAMDGTEPVAR